MNTPESDLKQQNHLRLLKEEYAKLQKAYNELEQKYSRAMLAQPELEGVEFSSFISRLSMQVANLHGRSVFSDIEIRLQDRTMPGHKFVLSARSTEWSEAVIADLKEIDWSDLDAEVGQTLLRWVYTDVVDLQHDALSLGLLRAAHRFRLPGLMGLCERALVASVGVRSCVRFYCVAEEVGAASLQDYCSTLISTHWDDLTTQDFDHMSSQLLFKMLKSKTKQPLHAAVRLLRSDTVLLCLNESSPEVVNSLSTQGQLPLGLALIGRSTTIADTLVDNGKANVNAVNGEGYPLLLDAIKRNDAFSVDFLLEKGCDVNVRVRSTGDTALHLICSFVDKEGGEVKPNGDLLSIAQRIISEYNANVNVQNNNGETPLLLSIAHGKEDLTDLLLEQSSVNVDIRTSDEKSALEFSLTHQQQLPPFQLAQRLLTEKNAQSNQIYTASQESLFQSMIRRDLKEATLFLAQQHGIELEHENRNGETALHLACQKNMTELVTILLQRMSTEAINVQTATNQSAALHMAVQSQLTDVVQLFVDANKEEPRVDFNLRDANGESPLKIALNAGQSELVPLLVQGGSDINERDEESEMTLLHEVIIKEDIETALMLLKQGADINRRTANGETALELAIHCKLPRVVDALCSHGVALLSGNMEHGDCPLWVALDAGEMEIAEILVKHGVDMDCWAATGPHGAQQTLLHRAIDEHKEAIAVFLIKSGCDIDTPRQVGPDNQGEEEAKMRWSPLHLCAQSGLSKIFKKLLDHGANANAMDFESKTPLHVATENQNNDIVEMLLYHHPNIDLRIRDKNGNTTFATAVMMRNHKAAQCILDRFPNAAEQIDQRGRNFVHTAIMKNDLESVLFLLSIQVDVNSRVHDVNQATPLHLAAAAEDEMLVRNLILAGSRVNELDGTGRTALHIAVEKNRPGAVSALLQNGADFDLADGDGNNSLHLAVREGHLGVVRVLLMESQINAEALNVHARNPLHELCRTGKDNVAVAICELFLESMPQYPINHPDHNGNSPLLLAYTRGQAGLCKVLVKNGACLGAENKEGVSIFNFQLATNQLLHKLLDQLAKESPWTTTESCQQCAEKFSLIMRKHHCRHCGRNLCSKCSSNEIPIIKFQINKPVRVCCVCFEVLQVGSD